MQSTVTTNVHSLTFAMKRSFQHVAAAVPFNVAPVAAVNGEPIAVAVTSSEINDCSRPRKHRVLNHSAMKVYSTPSSCLSSKNCNIAMALGSPLSRQWRCDTLESRLREEGVLHLVLSFLNFRDHQVIRGTSRCWRERVRTLEVDRLDVSARTFSLGTRSLPRACQALLQSYSRVRRLDVSGQRSFVDRDLLLLTSCFWPHLEEIVADDCQELTNFGALAVLNAQSFRLGSVSFRRCKKVTGTLFAGQALPLTGSHPSLRRINLDDTSVTRAFILHLEAHFPTLEHLSALHTPAHYAFFQQTLTLRPLLRELQLLVNQELVEMPLLPALLDEFNQWCHSPCRRGAGAFEQTIVATGSRALLDVPLFQTRPIDGLYATGETEDDGLVSLSPLLYACATGRTRVLSAILATAKGQEFTSMFDLENTDADGYSALSIAVANGFTEATRLLLRAGSDLNTRSLTFASPLYLASEHGWDVLVDMLLDVNARRDCAVQGGATAICAAAKNGHRSIVLRLLAAELQAEEEAQDGGCMSRKQLVQALFLACEGGHFFVVSDLLLLTELDANVLMDDNVSPLYLACQMGHVDIVSLLLSRGANPSFRRPQSRVSCLYIAAQEGHDHIVRLLVHAGADVHARMDDMSTALHIAARMGRTDVSRSLLTFGARLNDQTRSGLTALYIASEEGHVQLVHFLLGAGAKRDRRTSSGATAVFAAVHRGHVSVLEALLFGGANPSISKHNGTSPLDAAALLGDVKAARLLLYFGARVDGWTVDAMKSTDVMLPVARPSSYAYVPRPSRSSSTVSAPPL